MRLLAKVDFTDDSGIARNAGDEWIIKGPMTYIPRIEATLTATISATVILKNQALKLAAIKDTKDINGVQRKTGEEWLIREPGAYLPGIDEKFVELVQGYVITDKKALKLQAKKNFTDIYKIERKAGEQWLVTNNLGETHVQDVHETVVEEVNALILNNRQYCVILDAYDPQTRSNKWGSRLLKKGEIVFFLQPGESIEGRKIQNIEVLADDEALLLQAIEDCKDDKGTARKAGERWLITGPGEYIPPVQIKIIEKRRKIPLDKNEGIYVRNLKTGEVRTVIGSTYLLEAHETLWEKELPEIVENLLAAEKLGKPYCPPKLDEKGNLTYDLDIKNYKRDKTRVVSYRAPSNSAVQLFDYKKNESRVIFGPDIVLLGPDEQFTIQSLSAGTPKQEDVNKQLAMRLGPGFMYDVVEVETSDHARLSIKLSYGWVFRFNKKEIKEAEKIFSVKDFVGNVSKLIGSRVRGAVSGVSFDDFHKKRKELIQSAVFSGQPELFIPANNLVVTNVDVHNPEPVDPKMRDNLFRAQTLNIEITTKMQEMNARHTALRQDQESKGELDIQKYNDLAKAEEAKKDLYLIQAETEAIKAKGIAVAEARAKAESELIEIEAEVNQATLKADALKLETEMENSALQAEYDADCAYKKAVDELEIGKKRDMANIEVEKFQKLINAIGKKTLIAMAKAGPETQAKLMKGLGLKGFMISDGKNPMNLFNTANGLLGMNQ